MSTKSTEEITKRDLFAAMAMGELLAATIRRKTGPFGIFFPEKKMEAIVREIPGVAYDMADLMMGKEVE